MEYQGKMQFKVSESDNDIYCIIEINFDFPEIMETIKAMVEFWSEWEIDLEFNEGDYVKTILQYIGERAFFEGYSNRYNAYGVRQAFKDMDGFTVMDGTQGFDILQIENLEIKSRDLEVETTKGYARFEPDPW